MGGAKYGGFQFVENCQICQYFQPTNISRYNNMVFNIIMLALKGLGWDKSLTIATVQNVQGEIFHFSQSTKILP